MPPLPAYSPQQVLPSPPKIATLASKIFRIDLQPLKLIDFYLLFWLAQQRLVGVLRALTSMFKSSTQLRLENLALRQQLMVLRRSAPKRLKLKPRGPNLLGLATICVD